MSVLFFILSSLTPHLLTGTFMQFLSTIGSFLLTGLFLFCCLINLSVTFSFFSSVRQGAADMVQSLTQDADVVLRSLIWLLFFSTPLVYFVTSLAAGYFYFFPISISAWWILLSPWAAVFVFLMLTFLLLYTRRAWFIVLALLIGAAVALLR